MRTKSPNLIPTPLEPADGGSLAAPRWATDLVGCQTLRRRICEDDRLTLDLSQSNDFALLTARVSGIDALPPAEVEQATTDAYAAIARQLGHLSASHPVRF